MHLMMQLIDFNTHPTTSAKVLFACMPTKGTSGHPFLADNVLAEGPYGRTKCPTLPWVENAAPAGRTSRENPYMSSIGAALFEQGFWPCLSNTVVKDFVNLESSDRAKHGFMAFLGFFLFYCYQD